MKKQVFLLLVALLAIIQSAFAYDFFAVAPSGQTLFYNIVNGNAEVTYQNNYDYTFYSTYHPTGALTIPSSVTYNGTTYAVTSIGDDAFHSCSNLASVIIPNSVTTIRNYAFEGCCNLISVTIPYGVTWIGNWAFHFCTSLTSVTIPSSVTSIGANAFYGCSNLTSVTIPNSVTIIGYSAFSGCTSLISVTIPNSVTSMGENAFYNVRHIEYYGNATGSPWGALSMNGIVDGDFVYSDNTKHELLAYLGSGDSVAIPSSVDTIGNKAFYGCSNLTSVTIPNSVTSIGSSAFYSCSNLTSVTLGDKNLSVFSNDTTKGRAKIVLPSGSTSNLWNKTVSIGATTYEGNQFVAWSDGITAYSRTITLTENTTLTAIFTLRQCTLNVSCNNSNYGSVNGGGTLYYGDTATVTAYPAEHYHFIRWSDYSTENPHQIRITNDTYLTAYFAINTYTVNVQSNDLTRGYVTKSGTEFTYGRSCTVTATAFSGYTFACWSDGATENQYTFTVEQDMDLTAVFVAEGEQLYTVMLQSANPSMGTVSGGGRAIAGSDVVIKAKGKQGYRFVRWNDNNTDSIRTVHVSGDITYTAYFESTAFGIDDIESTEAKPIIFARDGNIIVREAQRMDVRVYDMMGRQVAYSATAEEHNIPMPMTGVYLVKVGTLPARKVVVIR